MDFCFSPVIDKTPEESAMAADFVASVIKNAEEREVSRQCMSEGVVGASTKDQSEGLCNPANHNELQTSPSEPSAPCSGNPKRTGTSALQPVKTMDTVVKDITPEESLVASTFVASVIQSAAEKEVSRQFVSEVFAGAILREQSKLLSSSTSRHDVQKTASAPNALASGQSKMSGSSALLPITKTTGVLMYDKTPGPAPEESSVAPNFVGNSAVKNSEEGEVFRGCRSKGVVGVSPKDQSEVLCGPANHNELQTAPSGPNCLRNSKKTSALQPAILVDTAIQDITPEESLVASTFIASVIQSAVEKEVSRQFVSEVFAGAILREQSQLLSTPTSCHDVEKTVSKPNALASGNAKMSSALLPVNKTLDKPPEESVLATAADFVASVINDAVEREVAHQFVSEVFAGAAMRFQSQPLCSSSEPNAAVLRSNPCLTVAMPSSCDVTKDAEMEVVEKQVATSASDAGCSQNSEETLEVSKGRKTLRRVKMFLKRHLLCCFFRE